MPDSPGSGLLSALVLLALGREHVNVVLLGALELPGGILALRRHGVRSLHDGRLPVVVKG